jgi:hypothetical protein
MQKFATCVDFLYLLSVALSVRPKQTETTRRWKVGLHREGDELPIRTKVEFSRREVHAARSAWDAMQEDVAERLEALR